MATSTILPPNSAIFPPRPTGTTVGLGGIAISSGSGGFSTLGTTLTTVSGTSITITTGGKPIKLLAISGSATAAFGIGSFGVDLGAVLATGYGFFATFARGGVDIASSAVNHGTDSGSAVDRFITIPCGAFEYTDVVAAGTYTYTMRIASNAPTATASAINIRLMAYELL